jgi:diaminopimelate epimerase
MTRTVKFTKMHGIGNDFVVLDGLGSELPPLDAFAARFSDRHKGIGFDQLLVLRASNAADFRMEIYNAEGGQVEMCGNGIRALFKYLRDRGFTHREEVSVETLGGVVRPRWVGEDRVAVDMGPPVLAPAKIPTRLADGDGPVLDAPLEILGRNLRLSSVSMGNPHAVVYVDELDAYPVAEVGRALEIHDAFPNRVNVEFVQTMTRGRLRQRTWERGVGETLACGSGACAVAVASMLRGVAEPKLVIELRGGELDIEWPGGDASVIMTGPAAEVFSGRVDVEEA